MGWGIQLSVCSNNKRNMWCHLTFIWNVLKPGVVNVSVNSVNRKQCWHGFSKIFNFCFTFGIGINKIILNYLLFLFALYPLMYRQLTILLWYWRKLTNIVWCLFIVDINNNDYYSWKVSLNEYVFHVMAQRAVLTGRTASIDKALKDEASNSPQSSPLYITEISLTVALLSHW